MRDKAVLSIPADTWASGDQYEPYVGRWSRLVAREFLIWLAVPARSRWLDAGCGTGALSATVLQGAAPRWVHAIDRSHRFIVAARRYVHDSRVRFAVADAQALPVCGGAYDSVVSGLVLNFLTDPDRAVQEMARATRPGGVVAGYVWDYAGKMQFMRHFWNAATALDPAALHLDEGRRFPLCQPEPLRQLFRRAHLKDVEVSALEVPTDFRDFDDYWLPFLGGQGPAPGYAMSLDEARRAALRERIQAGLPFALDGSIPLIARAWAVRGTR